MLDKLIYAILAKVELVTSCPRRRISIIVVKSVDSRLRGNDSVCYILNLNEYIKSTKWKTLFKNATMATLFIGVLTVCVQIFLLDKTIQSQERMKNFEVTFALKHESYTEFMRSLNVMFFLPDSILRGPKVYKYLDELEFWYYSLRPLLQDDNKARKIKGLMDDVNAFFRDYYEGKMQGYLLAENYVIFKSEFQKLLLDDLFQIDESSPKNH